MTARATPSMPYVNRDSGIPWIGCVPSHWALCRIKWTTTAPVNGIWGDEADGENDLLCVRVADFDRTGLRVSLANPTKRAISASDRKRRLLNTGDLLLEKSGGGEQQPVGVVVQYQEALPAVTSNFVARMTPRHGFDGRFLVYLHAHLYAARVNVRSINQSTGIQNLDADRYLAECVAVPPFPEQLSIAGFLDRETARIDGLVKKKRKQIELLGEQRVSSITRAVTGGLSSSDSKDSGIPWLGRIPKTWRVMTIAKLTSKLANGYVGPTRDILFESGIPYLQSLHIKDNTICFGDDFYVDPVWSARHARSILREGDVLIVQTGDIGQVAYVPAKWAGTNCHALIVATPNAALITGAYLSWVLNSAYGNAWLSAIQTGALHPHLNTGNVKFIPLPVPPVDEQVAIAKKCDAIASRTTRLIAMLEDGIALANNRRRSLIAAAVTGKIRMAF